MAEDGKVKTGSTYALQIDGDIKRWFEGLPLGNGVMGALLFGSSEKLILSLDRGDIWDRSGSPENTPGFSYANLIALRGKGDFKNIENIFDKPYNEPTPTKLPAGKLIFDLKVRDKGVFSLDMKRAEAVCNFADTTFFAYIHAISGVGHVKTNAKDVEYRLQNPRFGRKNKWAEKWARLFRKSAIGRKLKDLRYAPPVKERDAIGNIEYSVFIQPISGNVCYGVGVACRRGEQTELTYYAAYGEFACVKRQLQEKTLTALEKGYDGSLASHLEWWRNYFEKSSVVLPDKYIENRYNMGNYLLGSASRKGGWPMPLQGLWTESGDKYLPPWKGDYHNDLNTQLIYSSYLKANRLEQGECLIDYLIALTSRAREFASSFFGAKGLCLPGVMDIDGYALGGWAMYSLSPTNQLWLCQILERHYAYTGDKALLENAVYPYIEESAEFICSLLRENSDGYYVLPISSSPEIHDNTPAAYLTPNSNYDLALIVYILQTVIRLGSILGKDSEKWNSYLDKLQPFSVTENGVLMLSRDEILQESHRHMSHCMSVYPLRLHKYFKEEDKRVIDATVEYTQALGHKYHVGYSLAWLANLQIVRRNGGKAYELLRAFWQYFCSVNSFHLNGDYTKQGISSLTYTPFTLEGNFCALDAVQESLLYSEDGCFILFPAIPAEWKNVSFKTLRGWGGVLVSAQLKNGELSFAEFTAENGVCFELEQNLENFDVSNPFAVTQNRKTALIQLKKGETLTLTNRLPNV